MKPSSCYSVLLVEDCDDLRNLEASLLEDEGYHVTKACNGKEALDILNGGQPPPCIVLLDLMMPVMNGHQFLNAIRTNTKFEHIPVLIVSAVAEQPEMNGAIGFMRKPINLDILFETVSQYCPLSS